MKSLKLLVITIAALFILAGCAGSPSTQQTSAPAPTVAPTTEATETPVSPSPSAKPKPAPTSYEQLMKNDTGKTMIRKISLNKKNGIASLIVSKAGTVIACDPMLLPKGVTADIILVTHDHHVDQDYLDKCPDAKKSVQKAETFTEKDVTVTGIAASHTVAAINPDAPSLVIYVMDVDGLRIAFFSCCGQEKLTAEQMKALGKVDIAMITNDNDAGWISVELASGLMKQLKPKMVVPLTHNRYKYDDTVDQMVKLLKGKLVTVDSILSVGKEDLAGDQIQVVKLYNPVGTI